VPPPGVDGNREQIHLPEPSLVPLAVAIGLTIALVGLTFSSWYWFTGVGGAIVVWAAMRWVRAARREYDSLPTEHR
jgi:hypothetical protein